MTTDSRRRPAWRKFAVLVPLVGLLGCAHATASPPEPMPEPRDGRLRVITYNVHLGEALLDERSGGSRSMQQAFADEDALRDVDILGLQELCSNEGGWQVDYFDRLMRSHNGGTSWHVIALSDPVGKMMCARVEAIYSRFPIVDSGAIALPEVRQPRSAVWADIEIPAPDGTVRKVRVYNAHLENRAREGGSAEGRLAQARVILAHMEAWRAAHPDTPVLLLGDLNTLGRLWDFWEREQTLAEIVAHRLSPSLPQRERTLTLLPHQTDWIFADGLALKTSQVVHVWLSDHFPVVADYAWPDLTRLSSARKGD